MAGDCWVQVGAGTGEAEVGGPFEPALPYDPGRVLPVTPTVRPLSCSEHAVPTAWRWPRILVAWWPSNRRRNNDPSDIALGTARQAVERAGRCMDIARRVLATHR